MVKRRKECLFNCSIIGIQRILMRGNQKRERIFSSISLSISPSSSLQIITMVRWLRMDNFLLTMTTHRAAVFVKSVIFTSSVLCEIFQVYLRKPLLSITRAAEAPWRLSLACLSITIWFPFDSLKEVINHYNAASTQEESSLSDYIALPRDSCCLFRKSQGAAAVQLHGCTNLLAQERPTNRWWLL